MGASPCLKYINLGRTWWNCWKVDSATFHAGFCLGVGKHDRFVTTANSVVMPSYYACFLNLSIAALDPIDRVQPRSRITCVGWLTRFNRVADIHAV